MRSVRTIATVGGLALLHGACGGNAATGEQTFADGKTFTMVLGADPGTLDPHLTTLSVAYLVDRFMYDWLTGAPHGELWAPKVVGMKWRAVEAAKRVVDIALDVAGGAGMFRGNELERLYRDVRCGGFHPGNDAITHEMVGKVVLGIIAEQPRW